MKNTEEQRKFGNDQSLDTHQEDHSPVLGPLGLMISIMGKDTIGKPDRAPDLRTGIRLVVSKLAIGLNINMKYSPSQSFQRPP